MKLVTFPVSMNVKEIKTSKSFYEKLGFANAPGLGKLCVLT
jgi:predicted lactoylglutathione lyase